MSRNVLYPPLYELNHELSFLSNTKKEILNLIKQAEIEKDNGDYKKAIKIFNKILSKNYYNQDIYVWLVKYYISTQEFEKAFQTASDGIKKCSENEKLLFFLGKLYCLNNNMPKAFKVFEKAVKEDHSLLVEALNVCMLDFFYRNDSGEKYFNVFYNWSCDLIKKYPDNNYNQFYHLAGVYLLSLNKHDAALNIFSISNFPGDNEFKKVLSKKSHLLDSINLWIRHDFMEIINLCKKNKIKLFFLNFPEYKNPIMQKLSITENIPLIDIFIYFQTLIKQDMTIRKKYILPDNVHLSIIGNKIEAEMVYEKLLKSRIVQKH